MKEEIDEKVIEIIEAHLFNALGLIVKNTVVERAHIDGNSASVRVGKQNLGKKFYCFQIEPKPKKREDRVE